MENRDEAMTSVGSSIQKVGSSILARPLSLTEDGDEIQCAVCMDRGWLSEPIEAIPGAKPYVETAAVRCECKTQQDFDERQARYMKLCQLPAGTERWTFDTFKARPELKDAVRACRMLVKGELKWLTLVGKRDQGKSHLAVAVTRAWLATDRPACFVVVPEMLDALRRTIDPREETTMHSQFDFYCNVSLLTLDDLGMESQTDWAVERLDILINYRYQRELPLMVTSNLTHERMPPRIASRLLRAESSKMIAIEASEYRLQGGKK